MEKFGNTPLVPSEARRTAAETHLAEEQAVAAELQARSERIAQLRAAASVEAKRLLAERVPESPDDEQSALPYIKEGRIDQKIAALTALLAEHSQTKEGSSEPLNNDHRYLVEELAQMLENEKANRELIVDFNERTKEKYAKELRRYILEITKPEDLP